eukprot:CAMPEP_0206139402 /NCGR_PEP_ID=MMETSP1473-20131121/5850_1 /ASSEMBLY_ACC=CAM_ASM_001109 /TAXON_ID=1461547 /ORGANISM="Stichococcus sp, Strain RCC1054" /LENGTH=203 /DNA_ID=CAMNT_0053533179 /DNA_START=153 /DNA_END=764 /DNA_ORIENTATION=+
MRPAMQHRRQLLRSCLSQLAPFTATPVSARTAKGVRGYCARRPTQLAAAASAGGASLDDSTLQLGTAKLPADVDVVTFTGKLYQWANALTTNGQNLPLALPLRIDVVKGGFKMQLLRIGTDEQPVSVADINVTVERESAGNILYIRLAEAPGSGLMYPRRAGLTTPQYLKDLSDAVIDIPKVVTSMPPAIKLAIVQSRGNKKA